MARIRTIKPEFFTSEDIVALSAMARLLYVALWCESDKEGRMQWKPKTFKLRYFPADDCDIGELCDELLGAGLVKLYGDGLAYIPTFAKHQHVNPRETASVLPEPTEELTRHSRVSTREITVTDAQVGKEGKGRERKGKEVSSADPSGSTAKSDGSLAFEAYATAYETRYGTPPIRNAKVNSIFANLAKQLGEAAPAVAAWYVTSESLATYTKSSHDPALLLRDASGLHTRWRQRMPMSTKTANAADDAAGDMQMVHRVAARLEGLPMIGAAKPLALEERAPLI